MAKVYVEQQEPYEHFSIEEMREKWLDDWNLVYPDFGDWLADVLADGEYHEKEEEWYLLAGKHEISEIELKKLWKEKRRRGELEEYFFSDLWVDELYNSGILEVL